MLDDVNLEVDEWLGDCGAYKPASPGAIGENGPMSGVDISRDSVLLVWVFTIVPFPLFEPFLASALFRRNLA